MLQGYSFAKFGARYPSAGGLLEYVASGCGDGHFTGIIAWLILATNAIVTGMVAVSFGSYASSALTDCNSERGQVLRRLVVVVMTLLNIARLAGRRARTNGRRGRRDQHPDRLRDRDPLSNIDPHLLAFSGYPPLKDIISSVALTFFAFLGFGVVTFTAKDLAEPEHGSSHARCTSRSGIATVIYIAVALGVFGTLTVDEVIASGGTAIAVAAQPVLGRAGYWLMSITALFATAGATNAGLYPAAGPLRTDGDDRPVPDPRSATDTRTRRRRAASDRRSSPIVLAVGFDLSAIASIGSAIALFVFALITAGHLRVRHETGAHDLAPHRRSHQHPHRARRIRPHDTRNRTRNSSRHRRHRGFSVAPDLGWKHRRDRPTAAPTIAPTG